MRDVLGSLSRKCRCVRGSGDGLEGDLVAELLEPLYCASSGTCVVGAGQEVVVAKVLIFGLVGQDVPRGDEDAVPHGDQRPLLSSAGDDAAVPGLQVAVLCPGGSDRSFAERTT